MDIIEQAGKVFRENFSPETCFERAVFFSWYCGIADCTYCYMSTQPKEVIEKRKFARRSVESIIAEFIICKKLGWDIGFFSGGHDAFSHGDFKELLSQIHHVTGEKIWINVGALSSDEIEEFRPYIKGIVGAVETVNPEIHDKVCPSKPIEPMEKMFENASGLSKAITIILGLGETIDDTERMFNLIRKHDISKVHLYGLNPHPGTEFENAKPPTIEYQAEWIARTRVEFPKIDIQCGIWLDRVDRVPDLLEAGANSISKFPAIRHFGNEAAHAIEEGANSVGRRFQGSLTVLPEIDPLKETAGIEGELREKVVGKIESYLKSMRKNLEKNKQEK